MEKATSSRSLGSDVEDGSALESPVVVNQDSTSPQIVLLLASSNRSIGNGFLLCLLRLAGDSVFRLIPQKGFSDRPNFSAFLFVISSATRVGRPRPGPNSSTFALGGPRSSSNPAYW